MSGALSKTFGLFVWAFYLNGAAAQSCSGSSSSVFSVTSATPSGACVVTSSGTCISTASILGYTSGERCSICVRQSARLSVQMFRVESAGFGSCPDYLMVNGHQYCGSAGPVNVNVAAGSTMSWHTDDTVSGRGFFICGITSSSATRAPTRSPGRQPSRRPTRGPTRVPTRMPTTSCTPSSSGPAFSISSSTPNGACQIDLSGSCAGTGNLISGNGASHGNNERCSVCVHRTVALQAVHLDVEFHDRCNYDRLVIGSYAYCGAAASLLNGTVVPAGSTITWRSDYSATSTGWHVCAPSTTAPSLSQTSVAPSTVQPSPRPPSTAQPPTVFPTSPTLPPVTRAPVTQPPVTQTPISTAPATDEPTTREPTSLAPSSTSASPTTSSPFTGAPSAVPTTFAPLTLSPIPTISVPPTSISPTSTVPTSSMPSPAAPVTQNPSPAVLPNPQPSTIGPTSSPSPNLATSAPSRRTSAPDTHQPTLSTSTRSPVAPLSTSAMPTASPTPQADASPSSSSSSGSGGLIMYAVVAVLIASLLLFVLAILKRRRRASEVRETIVLSATRPANEGSGTLGGSRAVMNQAYFIPSEIGPEKSDAMYAHTAPPGLKDANPGTYGFHGPQDAYTTPQQVQGGTTKNHVYESSSPLVKTGEGQKRVGDYVYNVADTVASGAQVGTAGRKSKGKPVVHDGMKKAEVVYEVQSSDRRPRLKSDALKGTIAPEFAASGRKPSKPGGQHRKTTPENYSTPGTVRPPTEYVAPDATSGDVVYSTAHEDFSLDV